MSLPPLPPCPTCRGLFEEHKQLFAFLLCTAIQRHPSEAAIGDTEWAFLLRGPTGSAAERMAAPNPAKEWLTDSCWRCALYAEAHLAPLKGLCASLAAEPKEWRAWWVAAGQLPCSAAGGDEDVAVLTVPCLCMLRCAASQAAGQRFCAVALRHGEARHVRDA